MSTIYLLRHGEIAASNPRRFVGRLDLSLTSAGRQQMMKSADFLDSRSIDRLICSPLARCRQGASIVGEKLGILPEIVTELAEINLGSWEGLTVAEVEERYPGQYPARGKNIASFRPENGESFQDLLNRTWPVFETIASSVDAQIAVVTHAGVIRVLLCRVLGMPLVNLFMLTQDFGCINTLSWGEGGFQVDDVNYCPGKGR